MTNLEVLRSLPAEQLATFLTDQRMIALRSILEEYSLPVDGIESQIEAMFLKWLLAECEA